MEITLKNLIIFLPFDKGIKEKILQKFESLSEDQILALTKLCWQMVYDLVENQAQFEFTQLMIQTGAGKAVLKEGIYQEIEDKIYKNYLEKLSCQEEMVSLTELRKKIQESLGSQLNKISN